jgi:peptide/nickel transport system permease protein
MAVDESRLGERNQERLERLQKLWYRFSSNTLSVIGWVMLLVLILTALFAPVIAPFPEQGRGGEVEVTERYDPPSQDHIMGTDAHGRDIFSRVIFGARISLQMAAIVLGLSISIGGTLGLIAGYLGGVTNTIIMRTVDVFMSLPALLLAMVVAALAEPNLYIAMLAISAYWWTLYARIVQGEVITMKQNEFIEANRAIGASWYRTAFREILPNILSPVIVKATIDAGFVILVAATLGFLGLGTQPPEPDWGVMVAQGRQAIGNAWWVSTMPGLAIGYTVLAFNLIGDGLRDVFDVEEQL